MTSEPIRGPFAVVHGGDQFFRLAVREGVMDQNLILDGHYSRPMTRAELVELYETTRAALEALGIGDGDKSTVHWLEHKKISEARTRERLMGRAIQLAEGPAEASELQPVAPIGDSIRESFLALMSEFLEGFSKNATLDGLATAAQMSRALTRMKE